jgi:indole-3-glycerol phosphate synthase
MRGRRFSQAISEGDGISVIAEVADLAAARIAQAGGADGLLVRAALDGVHDVTTLPILRRDVRSPREASEAGFDACVLRAPTTDGDGAELARLYAEALGLGLDCVIEVHNDDELEDVLERVDPEIFLLSAPEADPGPDDELDYVLELLPDVPAGKLAIADVATASREHVVALERAGIDAVIVSAGNVAELVGGQPPAV